MRRDIIVNPITQTVVSIHASVKDATFTHPLGKRGVIVSIHASVKDATLKITLISINIAVSIHASVKDATQKCIQLAP